MTQTSPHVEAEIPLELLDALGGLPPFGSLVDAQRRGATCVWCHARLTAWTAIDLGEQISTEDEDQEDAEGGSRMRWFPRACPSCVADRTTGAFRAHTATCARCAAGAADCVTGGGLARLAKEYRR